MLLYDDVTSSGFQSYASMMPSPNMMHPIMLLMIPTMIVILYNKKLEKNQVRKTISIIVEIFYFLLLGFLLFNFFHFFSDMGFFPSSFVVVLHDLWTISLVVPIFMTTITLNLRHVLLFLRNKFPKLPFSSSHGSKCLNLLAWSYTDFCL